MGSSVARGEVRATTDKKVIPGEKVGTGEKLMVSAENQNGGAKDEPVRLEIAKALELPDWKLEQGEHDNNERIGRLCLVAS
jgi:hypothetical protein